MMKADVAAVTADTQAGAITITYRKIGSTAGSATYNPATGVITDPYTDVVTTALAITCKESDAKMAGMELEGTDRKMLIDISNIGRTPQASDLVVIGTTPYEVMWVRAQVGTNVCIIYLKLSGISA
jgi:hypothetical protein